MDNAFKDWFLDPGAYCLVDGQFGSTGKGLLSGYIAEHAGGRASWATTNAGPNSGHTAYFNNRDMVGHGAYAADVDDYDKVVTQQVPVLSTFYHKMGEKVNTLLNAGAIIDPTILAKEVAQWLDYRNVYVHPNAALITEADRLEDQKIVDSIAGTGKGIGPALARKILRQTALAGEYYMPMLPAGPHGRTWDAFWDWSKDVVWIETAQGFSLGVNSSRFYPNTTSRSCSVAQALADAGIAPQMLKKVVACYRSYPIRVGNTKNSSGGCYEDQRETSWEELGLDAEFTTVTRRTRRVFTWSRVQFRESVAVNRPDVLFCNFLNYLKETEVPEFIEIMLVDYRSVMGRDPDAVVGGWGPYNSDVKRIC